VGSASTRKFPTPVIVSLISGRLLCAFGELHECAEWVLGHPVWTHEFAVKALWDLMRAKVLEQHHDLDVDCGSVTQANWEAFRDDLVARLGPERELTKGDEERGADPLTTARNILGPDKPIIAIVAESSSEQGRTP
jgi:hypothetical protein